MERFSFDAAPKAGSGVFTTRSMRITVLTPCLVRLETGVFTDMPTQTVWNRNFGKVTYAWGQNSSLFTLKTEDATFCIDVGNKKMRSITLADGTVVTDFQKGNLLGTARTLDMVSGETKLEKGIMSRSGVAVLDDSRSLLLQQDGTILPRESCSDLYFFAYGHDYLRCLKDFFKLTGPVPLIPKYALGNWWSRYRAYTQEEYRELMSEFIRRKLPVTVATIDMDWHWTDVLERFGRDARPGKPRTRQEIFYNLQMPGWTGYSWNTELFPDHKELLTWLHDQGFHVTLNVHPSQGVRYYEDCYADVCLSLGKDPEKRERIPFEIGDLRFVKSYMDDIHHPLEEEGVDFWWLDWQQGTVTAIPGLDPLWALNHYHYLDNGRGENRPLILSRYAGLGSHRYPLGFSGDTVTTWKSLDFQPYFTNNAANAGYTWWSHDIGGHMHGDQDDELYLRWLQYGVFSPINRLHSSNSDFMGKEPWKRCCAVEMVSEQFLRLRHKLIPYLYSANYQTYKEGIPLCMPMYYRYDCEEAYEAPNQYIFGSQLMVCPITKPMDKRLNLASTRVWLPEGRWTDFFSGRIYQGGRWVTMYRDLDSIPVLAGEGAIVPVYRSVDSNDLSLEQPLEIHVWRGQGSFELYEDDGETKAFRDGHYAITPMEVTEQGNGIQFTIRAPIGDRELLPKKREMYVRFRDVVAADVAVNGKSVPVEEGDCVCVPVTVGGEELIITLKNVLHLENQSKETARTNLLTRVQGNNDWKVAFSAWKHIPEYIKDALQEFDAFA